MSVVLCLIDSPVKWGVTVRSWRCCVPRTNRAGPAGWPPSDCSKYFLYFQMVLPRNDLSAHGTASWRHLSSLVSSQYGIVLYQSYNVPQQRKSNLSPFTAPVVRIYALTSSPSYNPALMPPLSQDQSRSINQLMVNWEPVHSVATVCLAPLKGKHTTWARLFHWTCEGFVKCSHVFLFKHSLLQLTVNEVGVVPCSESLWSRLRSDCSLKQTAVYNISTSDTECLNLRVN